ncbi:hypothetical protein P9112_006711 [Eukaryota sp. TZLM1-RC]
MDKHCFKESFVLAVSVAILLFSSIVKLPQVIKLLSTRSSKEISLPSVIVDLLCYAIGISFSLRSNLPIKSFAEAFPLYGQTLVILCLCVIFSFNIGSTLLLFLAMLLNFVIFSNLVNISLLSYLHKLVITLGIVSKVLQISKIIKSKSSNSVSLLSLSLMTFGNYVRLYTLLSTGNRDVVLASFVGCLMNTLLLSVAFGFDNAKLKNQ